MIVSIGSRDFGFPVIHIKGNSNKVMLGCELINLGGYDIQKPESPSRIGKVLHPIGVF
jgi:hypothetical protein